MKIKNKGFTMVELIIVITILAVLSTLWTISYVWKLSDARNSSRISDIGNIMVSLKNHKFKASLYPDISQNPITISNNWVDYIKQWYLDDNIYTDEITNKPIDPLTKTHYKYWITTNRLYFQIAMIMEDKWTLNWHEMIAYVDGDFQTASPNLVWWLIYATNSSWDLSSLSWNVIVHNGTYNLPYDRTWEIINGGKTYTEVINQWWVRVPKFCGHYSCIEIYEKWRYIWPWNYCILDNNWTLKEDEDCDHNSFLTP